MSQELRDRYAAEVRKYRKPPRPRSHAAEELQTVVWICIHALVVIVVILGVLVLLGLSAAVSFGAEDTPLPVVHEHYDTLLILSPRASSGSVIVFVRGDRIFATRWVQEEMVWESRDGRFCLRFRDYWICDRVITFDCLTTVQCEADWTQGGQGGEWWQMGRRMQDLAAPNEK